ncbi:MAG TPA: YncE family protein, partial [Vicinamibacterales bacterium]|nr:YncE family protein [Vicinamibacterales bacterium]
MRRAGARVLLGIVIAAASISPLAQRGPTAPIWPGYQGEGITLLPNGWRIAPEGRHITVGDLPMNVVPSPDGRFLAISSSGYTKPALSILDTRSLQIVNRLELEHTWLGLVWHPDGKRLFASGSSENVIYEFSFQGGRLTAAGNIQIGLAERHPGRDVIENAGYVAGLEISGDGRMLYAAQIYGQKVRAIDIAQRKVTATADLPAEPYTCVLSPDGQTLLVSVWGGAKVVMLDPSTLAQKGEFAVGEHPNAMEFSRDGKRLFVACANTNAVWILDLATGAPSEQISVALGTQAPVGSTPNGLALSPDGRTLLIANADNNTVTVADVSKRGAAAVQGWIPVGWYPTAVLFDRDGSRLFVL